MYFKWHDISLFYEIKGQNGPWILFLHGWGGNHQSFAPLYEKYKGFRILTVDFPPFGNSTSPGNELFIENYVQMIVELLKSLKIREVKVISHSFGGRVAILLSSRYNIVSALILCDSAGIKPRKSIHTKLKIFKYKLFKKLGIKQKNVGSSDYRQLSPIMKKTFVNVVNAFLEKDCKSIKCPCLIIWGKKDKDTPIYMAKTLHKLIKNSKLFVFENAGHFAYLEKIDDFYKISIALFKKENL